MAGGKETQEEFRDGEDVLGGPAPGGAPQPRSSNLFPAGCGVWAWPHGDAAEGTPGRRLDEPSHGEELTPKLAMRLGTAWLDPPERPPERVCARARPDPGNSWRIPKARGRANVGARVSAAAAAAAGQSGSETSEGPETRTLRPSTALGERVQTRRSRRLPRWENRFVHSGPWGRRTDAAFLFEPFCQPGV